MKVLITGGAGFLGQRLAGALAERGGLTGPSGALERIDEIVLLDTVEAAAAGGAMRSVAGDAADPDVLTGLIGPTTTSIFHLAAVVSGAAEADFDLGYRVNVDATRALLETCRALGGRPRVVFASSVAVFGGDLPELVPETLALSPQSSYGTQKAIGELLIADYTRKGFVDGRALRLPTVVVRPGRPNAAASSFASGIVRESLRGEPAVCPVAPDTRVWIASPRTVIEAFILGHELPGELLGARRALNLPGLSIEVNEMIASLGRVGGADAAARVRLERDPRIERLVTTWPVALDASRALGLGFPVDTSFDAIVEDYIREQGSVPGTIAAS